MEAASSSLAGAVALVLLTALVIKAKNIPKTPNPISAAEPARIPQTSSTSEDSAICVERRDPAGEVLGDDKWLAVDVVYDSPVPGIPTVARVPRLLYV